MSRKWIKYYEGFESIDTLVNGEDIEDFLEYVIPKKEDGKWQGTLSITVEYFPWKDDDQWILGKRV